MPTLPLVVIDPGHGGTDPGALSPNGWREADFNLALSKAFEKTAKVIGTFTTHLLRTADDFVSLSDRAKVANALAAAAVLSFHCNSFLSPVVRGFEVWTTPGQTGADPLATRIFNGLHWVLPFPGRSDNDDGDPDKETYFYILRRTVAPAVLIEFGFMSNHDDATWFSDASNQEAAAGSVAWAVDGWLTEGK